MAVPSSVMQLLYQSLQGSTPNHYSAKTAVIGAATQTTGSGLSDATSGGTYTATIDHTYRAKITTAAGTDQVAFSTDGGAFGGSTNVTGSAQTIANGVTITFAATTGHTLNDVFTIVVTAGVVVTANVLRNLTTNSVGSGAELKLFAGTSSAGTLLYDALTASWTAGNQNVLNYFLSGGSLYVVLYASSTYPDLIVGTN